MAVHMILRDALDGLATKDFKIFQWHLTINVLDGCRPIPKHCLEDQSRTDTVTEIIDRYGKERAVNIANVILERMGFNNIREMLMNAYAGAANAAATGSSSSSSSSIAPAAPAVPVTMSAQQGSVIISPMVTSGTVGTLNISISKS